MNPVANSDSAAVNSPFNTDKLKVLLNDIMNGFFALRLLFSYGITLVMLSNTGLAQEPKLGDVSDGNRSHPVHVIDLLDEDSTSISPDDTFPLPFSLKQTCQGCHDYKTISGGWHFNATSTDVSPGRRGEPWVLADPISATQVPLSHRNWKGTLDPEKFGLSPFLFTEKFGRHLNGGGIGENDSTESLDIYLRWLVSGKAEVNCLSCHDAEPGHDQSEYDLQIRRQNYRWAAAATSGFAMVSGSAKAMPDNYDIYSGAAPDLGGVSPPKVEYDKNRFNGQGKVLFNIAREAPEQRCYFCHSAKSINVNRTERWETDQDVHLTAGMTCVDCHRNGLDHQITRGYEWESENSGNVSAAPFSCAGCHLRDEGSNNPQSGRLGAPYPSHKGLPAIHFDKLSCTACHSGPWPTEDVQRVKLSRTHALGTFGVKKGDDAVPYILSPVYARDDDGKISPHRLLWPAYWAFMNADDINPAALEDVRRIALTSILQNTLTDSTNIVELRAGNWPQFSETQIVRILNDLKTLGPEKGTPVYIGGGALYSAPDTTHLIKQDHPAAQPYSWAFAHDVRPAEQSLGLRGCNDCHAIGSPFSFGTATAPVPFDFSEGSTISMTSLQDMDAVYPRVFALTFLFRPFLKNLILICCFIVLSVLLLFMLKGLNAILNAWSGKNS